MRQTGTIWLHCRGGRTARIQIQKLYTHTRTHICIYQFHGNNNNVRKVEKVDFTEVENFILSFLVKEL